MPDQYLLRIYTKVHRQDEEGDPRAVGTAIPATKLEKCPNIILQQLLPSILPSSMSAITAMQDPGKGKGTPGTAFTAAAAALQLRLLEAYLALPDASAFTMEHAAVSKLCARALRSAPGQASSGTVGVRPGLHEISFTIGLYERRPVC